MGAQPFRMVAGRVWRKRRPAEVGSPELVTVSKEVAKRCRYLRMEWDGGWRMALGYQESAEQLCAVFQDPETNEVYCQPVEED